MNKLRLFLVLGMALVLVSSACTEKKNENPDAKLSLDELLEKYPDSIPLLTKRARLNYEKGSFDLTMQDAARAYRLDSNNFEARILYAHGLNNRVGRVVEDLVEAKRQFEVLLKKEPKNTEVLVGLASVYSQFQDFENSFKYINDALKIDQRYRDAYVLKGSNYAALGNKELMKSSYETAIQQDPEFYLGYFYLGSLYQQEQNPIAIEYFETAYQLRPNDQEFRYALAYAKQHLGKLDAAKEIYREMAKDTVKYYPAQALFQLGHIKQFVDGDLDSAIYFYQEATYKSPNFVEAYHNMGICFDLKKDKTNALLSFGKALKINPEFKLSRDYADSIR